MIIGERVVEIKGTQITTDKGRSIDAEVIFACVGLKPNTEYAAKGMPDALDKNGYFKVNKHLQVGKYKTVFAAGDCVDLDYEKVMRNARNHVKVILQNILKIEAGDAKLIQYNGGQWKKIKFDSWTLLWCDYG